MPPPAGLGATRSREGPLLQDSSSKSLPAGSWCPGPIAYLGRVLEVLPRVGGRPCDRRLALRDQGGGAIPRARTRGFPGAPERLRGQVVAAHAVEDHHVERGRRGTLLVEAADVEPVDVHVAVDDLV